jgi:predicted DCC family thiol-disulfide oxidoreductase YuxK
MDWIQDNAAGIATLYYDGRCPLCASEMARLERHKSDRLQLQDIHDRPDEAHGPDRETLLRTLHLRLPDGSWLTGADANIAAWQFTRGGAWLRWLRWPIIRTLVDSIYDLWARRRYHRLYGKRCPVGESQ